MIVEGSRACVDECPSGRSASWSALPDYMGKVCLKTGPGGLSGAGLAVAIGACAGGIVCIIIITAGILIARYRKRPQKKNNSQRAEFLKELDRLRPQSYCLLAILNDIRRQIREVHANGDTTAALTYWPVVRDLAKLLYLLNRPVETIVSVPNDWKKLNQWAEKLIARYKHISNENQPQVAQLINFLQSPSFDDKAIQTSVSTFKPSNGFGSALSLQDFVEPFSDGNTITAEQWQLRTNAEGADTSLWLEDECFQLGLRPQDEITTEL